MDRNMTVRSGRPARDSPSRARPTAAMATSHTFWNARYSEIRLPNIPRSLSRIAAQPPPCSGRLVAVDHPRYAESIEDHSEAQRPEGPLDRHLHRPVLGQGLEYPLGILRLGDAERNVEALRLLVVLGRRVRAHQRRVADLQASVNDPIPPPRGYLVGHRGVPVSLHGDDLPAQALLVEPERGLAVTIEVEIGNQLHGPLLRMFSAG